MLEFAAGFILGALFMLALFALVLNVPHWFGSDD